MKKTTFNFVLVLLLVSALGACVRTSEIYNIDSAGLLTSKGAAPTLAQVKVAITAALLGKRWEVKKSQKGLIIARYTKSNLYAEIEIKYNNKQYSVKYKDSMNIKYGNGKIHSNYNRWIRNLRHSIQVQMLAL